MRGKPRPRRSARCSRHGPGRGPGRCWAPPSAMRGRSILLLLDPPRSSGKRSNSTKPPQRIVPRGCHGRRGAAGDPPRHRRGAPRAPHRRGPRYGSRAEIEPIELDDPCSVAARARSASGGSSATIPWKVGRAPGCPDGPDLSGESVYLRSPCCTAHRGTRPGRSASINFTDRVGEEGQLPLERSGSSSRRSRTHQIGAAIENARLVARDRGQQRLQLELKLARDLQLKLLPSPLVIADRADVAARCRQAESVGGDFYNLVRLTDGRMGVMIGDVTSHGFSAALIMALVMAANVEHPAPRRPGVAGRDAPGASTRRLA